MALNFLSMCSPPVNTGENQARAEIDVKRFSNWRDLPMSALLTEGINQFAVRFARTVLPGVMERRQRVLPVGIRNLAQTADLGTGPYLVEGDVCQFGPTARVRITVRDMHAGAAAPCLFQAEVAAAVAGEAAVLDGMPQHADSVLPLLWNVGADPLFRVTTAGDANGFGFEVSATCPLLEEHFPGFPVAPGSLVLAFVWEQAARRLGVRVPHLRVDDARFVRPVTPGVAYTCSLRPLADKPRRYRFALTAPDGTVATQGVFHFQSAAAPAAVPELAEEAA